MIPPKEQDSTTREGTGRARLGQTSASDFVREGEFGPLLRKFREDKGYNQVALAELLQRSTSLLSLLENGQRHPTRKIIDEFSGALGLSDDERHQLLRAGGYSDDALSGAVRMLVTHIDKHVPLDEADRLLVQADLMSSLAGWKSVFEGRKLMRDGKTERARDQFESVVRHDEYAPSIRAYAQTSLADTQMQLSALYEANHSVDGASKIIASWPDSWAPTLRAENLAVRGLIALRNGLYSAAERLVQESMAIYRSMLFAPDAIETISRQGLGKSYKRLAQIALFKGDPRKALEYCLEADMHLRDIRVMASRQWWARRILELKGWAYSELDQREKAVEWHSKALSACREAGDDDGVTKNYLYLGDDYRRSLRFLIDEHLHSVAEKGRDIVTPERRREEVRHLLERHVDLLEHAERHYDDARDGCARMSSKLLLGRCLRSQAIISMYRAILDNDTKSLLLVEQQLQEALKLDSDLGQLRRLPSVYSSLLDLTWFWGKSDWQQQAMAYSEKALDALDTLPVSTSDQASQDLREQVKRKHELLFAEDLRISHSKATSVAQPWHELIDPTASSAWKDCISRLLTLVRNVLMSGGFGSYSGSDRNIRWLDALYHMENQPGPRVLAQNDLSFSLSLISRGGFIPDELASRHFTLYNQIVSASATDERAPSRDYCCRETLTHGLRDMASRPILLDQMRNVAAWMKNYSSSYLLESGPYELPFGFAVKGNHLLLEFPYKVARALLDIVVPSPTADGKICYRIIRGENIENERFTLLADDLKEAFDTLISIARSETVARGEKSTLDWLESTLKVEAADLQKAILCQPAL